MRAFIADKQLWIHSGNVTISTRLDPYQAGVLAKEIRAAIYRTPREIRKTWNTPRGPARFTADLTAANPWPTLSFHNGPAIRPTDRELEQFLEALKTYSRGPRS